MGEREKKLLLMCVARGLGQGVDRSNRERGRERLMVWKHLG